MKEKLSVLDVKEIVWREGLEYAIIDYINADDIQDQKLRLLWSIAENAVNDVSNYLEDNL